MPTEFILTALGTSGLTTAFVALLLFVAQGVINRSLEARADGLRSELRRAEAELQSRLAAAEARLSSELARAEAAYRSELARAEEQFRQAVTVGSQIDIHLREQRIAVYKELWMLTGNLPLWPRNPDLTYEGLDSLSRLFRDWYFKLGGIWLSGEAREAYGAMQEQITAILSATPSPAGPLSDEHYTSIRDRCSALRTRLTTDLLSRIAAPERPPRPAPGGPTGRE